MRSRQSVFSVRNGLALLLVALILLVAVAAPWLAPPDDPENPTPFHVLFGRIEPTPLPPSQDIPLGTVMFRQGDDIFHFDVFHSLVWGTRAALRFGLVAAGLSALIGVGVGLVSGYAGGWFNRLAIRITDAFLAFPMIAGIWLFNQLFQDARLQIQQATWLLVTTGEQIPPTFLQQLLLSNWIDPVMLTFILFSWMPYARIINASVLKVRKMEFVEAARSLGGTHVRIIFRHLLPNVIAPVIVLAARDVGAMVILQTAFAFIGVSGDMDVQWALGQWFSPVPEWARLLVLGRDWVIGAYGNPLIYWWMYLPPTVALVLFGTSWNVLGDRLNGLLNPRES